MGGHGGQAAEPPTVAANPGFGFHSRPMRIYYYHDSYGNFGDELNQWLWPRMLPRGFDSSDNALLLGIGTLIREEVPSEPVKVVLGAGIGYGDLPRLDESWRFYAVRGPRTAAALGLPGDLSMTDAAALLNVLETRNSRQDGVGFMPHHLSRGLFDWGRLCRRIGVTYLDPRAPVPRLLDTIKSLRLVLAEAMHGAIVADALRVPWIPVRAYPHINTFKWEDWTASLELPYAAHALPALYDNHRLEPAERMREYLRRAWRLRSLTRQGSPPRETPTTAADAERATAQLADLARHRHGATLSDDAVHADRLERLSGALARVIADWIPASSR